MLVVFSIITVIAVLVIVCLFTYRAYKTAKGPAKAKISFLDVTKNYGATTVWERLYLMGLSDQFDDAVKKRDVNEVISILKQIGLDESIPAILKSQGLIR